MIRMASKVTKTKTPTGVELPHAVALLIGDTTPANVAKPSAFAMADIATSGGFGETWAALAGDQLFIVDMNGNTPELRATDLTGERKVEVTIIEGVGSSRFRVIVDGHLQEELRFSCRQARRFSRFQHRVEDRIKGRNTVDSDGTPVVAPDEDKVCNTCERAIPDWTDNCPHCLHQRKIIVRLMSYVLRHKRLFYIGMGAAVLGAMLMAVPPFLTKYLIDDVLASDAAHTDWLWPLIGILGAVIAARVYCEYLRLNRLAMLGEQVAHDLRAEAFNHLRKLSLAYFTRKPTGQLVNRITHDSDRLWDFIAFGLVNVTISSLMIVIIAVVLLAHDPILALLTFTPVPVGIVLMYLHTRRMRPMLQRIWAKWGKMTSVLSDVLPGMRVVKAFTQEDREVHRFTSSSKAVLDDTEDLHGEWTRFWPKITLLLNLGTLIVWSYAGPRIIGGEFEVGEFVMFLSYIWMFYGPIEELGVMNRVFQRAATSAQRIFDILDTPPTVFTKSNPVARPSIEGRVRFEDVSFTYDGVKRVLQDVSFEVEPGEMIGLAGPSGGGKTTLVNLICRFYDPIDGRVFIDGIDVRDMNLHELRSQIGVVLQEPYLFAGTVAQNIAYGNHEADMDRIIEAARAANAHDFIVGFPDGYDTIVGERGQTLSGGERQRLSIARAILNNPRVLILDEATSSVDSKTEMKIQEAIDRLVEGRTTFAIAHRLSTLRKADRLLILKKGKLAECGTHEELIAADGVYAELHRTQAELAAVMAV